MTTAGRPALAQTATVSTAGDLVNAVMAANAWSGTGGFTIDFTTGVTIQPTSQLVIGLNEANTAGLVINGNGATIDMQSLDRAFFIASGSTSIANLTIANGAARGGNGADSGGGGAGLGGAIFVANPTSVANGVSNANLVLPTVVTLTNVAFLNNLAQGGLGAGVTVAGQGGGGGMGGNGANGSADGGFYGGGGGGGFGLAAQGGAWLFGTTVDPPGAGGFGGWFTADPAAGGSAAEKAGGSAGGGGAATEPVSFGRSGGGGGVNGAQAVHGPDNPVPPVLGAMGQPNGGYGGGGGGGGYTSAISYDDSVSAGNGGFGGGAGGGLVRDTPPDANHLASGGFGGGGGGNIQFDMPGGYGGFAGGRGEGSVGGGGAGLGGAVFVMDGASLVFNQDDSGGTAVFQGSTVVGGTTAPGGHGGSAYGADVFLGADVTFNVSSRLTVDSLGGSGNQTDPNVASTIGDGNADGGLIKTGLGVLVLTGSNTFSGDTTVHAGTLTLGAGAVERGTRLVVVGKLAGDEATLVLGSQATLAVAGFSVTDGTDLPVVVARDVGSTGSIVIGDGAGSSGAFVAARTWSGGSGTAAVVFTQQYAASSGTDTVYPFYTTLTGSLSIVQQGIGTTLLQPIYGANTFAGTVTVVSGTLATSGTAAALAGVAGIDVAAGGTLSLGQTNGVNDAASLTLAGGVLQTGTGLAETFASLAVTGAPSIIDFLGNSSSLTFGSLTLGGPLSIWNYSATGDFITVDGGTVAGNLEDVSFYSDAGTTFLGVGGFAGTSLVPVAVPEPGTLVLAVCGVGVCVARALRQRKRAASHAATATASKT